MNDHVRNDHVARLKGDDKPTHSLMNEVFTAAYTTVVIPNYKGKGDREERSIDLGNMCELNGVLGLYAGDSWVRGLNEEVKDYVNARVIGALRNDPEYAAPYLGQVESRLMLIQQSFKQLHRIEFDAKAAVQKLDESVVQAITDTGIASHVEQSAIRGGG